MRCETAYVNGDFLPLERASVPVLDRGLLFADAVYEVIPVYAGQPFLLDAHIQRLQQSLDGIRLPNPHSASDWRGMIRDLIERNGGGDIAVYVQVTRGVQARRDHALPETPAPTVIAFCQTRPAPDPDTFSEGITAVTANDDRWQHCEIKSTALLPNVLLADKAAAAGAAEAILLRNGEVTEGASSNVFVVHDGLVTTPPLAPTILPGITRAEVLRLARDNGVATAERAVDRPALANADEIWLTSSTREIYPVTTLDNACVGDGRPGPLWRHLRALLQSETHGT